MLCNPQRLIPPIECHKLRLEKDVSPNLQRPIKRLHSAKANCHHDVSTFHINQGWN